MRASIVILSALALASGAAVRAQEETPAPDQPVRTRSARAAPQEDTRPAAEMRKALDELRAEHKRLRERLDKLEKAQEQAPNGVFTPWVRVPTEGEWQGHQDLFRTLRFGGGGSKVVIRTDDGKLAIDVHRKNDEGEDEVKTYTGDQIREFAKQHHGLPGGMTMSFENGRITIEHPAGSWITGSPFGAAQPVPSPHVEGHPPVAQPPVAPPAAGGVAGAAADPNRLGVMVEPLSESEEGEEDAKGLAVREVMAETLASRLGIQEGDVVISINGKATNEVADVRKALSGLEADETVKVEVRRGDETKTLSATKTKAAAKAGKKKL